MILARRSRRLYDLDRPITFEQFSTVLDRSARGFAADCLAPGGPPLHDSYLIVNAVEGLAPRALPAPRARRHRSSCLRSGEFRAEAAHLAFDQPYAGPTPT